MNVTLLQHNPTVGDFSGNVDRIVSGLRQAEQQGADLVLCPELAVVGYPPRDLLDQPHFVAHVQRWTERLIEQTGEVPLVFGTVGYEQQRLTNDAVVAVGGKVLMRSSKVLLPNYDVFDEQRHFSPGTSVGRFVCAGLRCVVSICEDAWGGMPELAGRYGQDPLLECTKEQTDLIINLSASPFTLHKLEQREALFSGLARARGVAVAMVNQVGGNDELLFDGRSALFDGNGEVIARARAFDEDVLTASLTDGGRIESMPEVEEAAYRALVMGVRDYARKCGFARAVLGLSGGIDSALVATIAVDALGAENVVGVAMPTRYSSAHSVDDARQLAYNLGLRFELVDIDGMFAAYIQHLSAPLDRLSTARDGDVTWENVQARIRGATVMALSNRSGALPLTTGNKSEIAVGYCTLYGDMVGGLAVISDVPKTMVYRLARWVNREKGRIPQNTIDKPPSAELRPDQKDEDSLPPYEVLDPILEGYVEKHQSAEELVAQGFDANVVEQVVRLVRGAEYKRKQAAPGLIITHKAFGSGRRMPVAQRYVDMPGNTRSV